MCTHVKGSHHVLRHPNNAKLRVIVPVHRKDLPPGTLHSILRQAELTIEGFLDLLKAAPETHGLLATNAFLPRRATRSRYPGRLAQL